MTRLLTDGEDTAVYAWHGWNAHIECAERTHELVKQVRALLGEGGETLAIATRVVAHNNFEDIARQFCSQTDVLMDFLKVCTYAVPPRTCTQVR